MKTLGRREHVEIRGVEGRKWIRFDAKLDTGADRSRISAKDAAKLRLGPIERVRKVRGERRVVVPATVQIAGRKIRVHFTVSTRWPGLLIGVPTMKKRFRVDPSREYLSDPRKGVIRN